MITGGCHRRKCTVQPLNWTTNGSPTNGRPTNGSLSQIKHFRFSSSGLKRYLQQPCDHKRGQLITDPLSNSSTKCKWYSLAKRVTRKHWPLVHVPHHRTWRAFLKRPGNFTGPESPFVKLQPAHSVKLVSLYVVKGIKIKITAKFRDTEHLRFEDTKRSMSSEKFRVFRDTGPRSVDLIYQPLQRTTKKNYQRNRNRNYL